MYRPGAENDFSTNRIKKGTVRQWRQKHRIDPAKFIIQPIRESLWRPTDKAKQFIR